MIIPYHPLRYPFRVWRHSLVQPLFWALFFLAPLTGLFATDVIAGDVIFLGQRYPFSFQSLMWLPIVFYAGVLAIGVISLRTGRLFCGWACPHSTMVENTRWWRSLWGREPMPANMARVLRQWPPWALPALRVLSIPYAIGLTWLLSALLASYLVPLDWIYTQYASGNPHIALVWGQGLFVLIGLFLLVCGHDFCRTCCPYGMAQSISAYQAGKRAPMAPRLKTTASAADCGTCTACQQVCPVDIDPRNDRLFVGQFEGCFNCGECIDACKHVSHYARPGQGPLLAFH